MPFSARLPAWTPELGNRLARAAQAILIAMLAIQVVRLAWLLVPPAPIGLAEPDAALAEAAVSLPVGFDPFFPAHSASVADSGSGSVVLYGVRTAPDGGTAILGEPGGSQGSYRPGESITPGQVLVSVAADHVVLEAGGKRTRLGFAEAALDSAPMASSSLPTAAPAPAPASVDPQQLLAEAGLQPRMQDGQHSGYTLIPRGTGALLQQAGLQAGDVLLSINGQTLTPERYSSLAEELAGEPRLEITFQRGDETRTLSLQAKTP